MSLLPSETGPRESWLWRPSRGRFGPLASVPALSACLRFVPVECFIAAFSLSVAALENFVSSSARVVASREKASWWAVSEVER